MSTFEEILAFMQPPPNDDPKAVARDNLKVVGASTAAEDSTPVEVEKMPVRLTKRQRVVLDNEDEGEEGQVAQPAKRATIKHAYITRDNLCGDECQGLADPSCDWCGREKAKCEKSSGCGGHATKAVDESKAGKDPKEKGRAPVRSNRSRRVRAPAHAPESDLSEDGYEEATPRASDEGPGFDPRFQSAYQGPIDPEVREAGVKAVIALDGKMLHAQAEMLRAQAKIKEAEAAIDEARAEIAVIRAAFGVL